MGCGISKFDPKEVVEATTNGPHNPPHPHKSSSNCFSGESKSFSNNNLYSNASSEKKMKVNVTRGGAECKLSRRRTMESEDCSDDGNYDDYNCREICRGGSPSFREYCIDYDSVSRSMRSDDNCDGDSCKWTHERTPNLEKEMEMEKEKGEENETEKKERRGKGLRKALQRRKSGGVKSFSSDSQEQQTNSGCSEKLLAIGKAS